MSKSRVLFRGLVGIFLAALCGLGLWYFRQTNFVASLVIDSLPLAQTQGYTNVVILGVGGEGHDGGDLTDTILLLSLKQQDNSIRMLSIPRDIWVDSLKIKINAAYHYGKEQNGDGLALSKSALSEVLGIPIHYGSVIDFSGFIKLIDIVGGIDVQVQNSFDDYKYPIPGKETAEPESARYEHLHFEAGLNHFDGVTALKYARSRHALGDEGTDFARGARQQQVILALKDKILTSQTLLNLQTLTQIIESLSASIDTDVKSDLYRSFFEFGIGFQRQNAQVKTGSITNYLDNPKNLNPYGGAWVLIPSVELKPYVASFLAE